MTYQSENLKVQENEKLRYNNYLLIFTLNLFLFIVCFTPQFTRYALLMLLIVNLVYSFIESEKIIVYFKTNNNRLVYYILLYIFINFLGLKLNHSGIKEAIRHVSMITIMFWSYINLISFDNWYQVMEKFLIVICSIFLIGSIVQLIFPETIHTFNKWHLSQVLYDISLEFYRNGALNGITHQTGVNAFILSLLMGIIFSNVVIADKINIKSISLILFYIFLFLLIVITRKRASIVFHLAIFGILFPILIKNKKLSFSIIITLLILVIIFLFFTDSGKWIIIRTKNQVDITTGRLPVYRIMWKDFLNKPLFGNGTYTTMQAVKTYNGHNIYLQVLRENGIIGFILLMLIIGYSIFNSLFVLIARKIKYEYNKYLVLSIYLQLYLILYGLVGNPLYDSYTMLIYMISIGISSSIIKEGNKLL